MKRIFFSVIIITFIFSSKVPEVKTAGAMRNVMQNGDLSATISLDTLKKNNLYALGAVTGLKGEIMILDGKSHISQIGEKADTTSAAMLVYSYIKKWQTIQVEAFVKNYADLEKLVATTAKENGYDLSSAFAFMIKGKIMQADYHIIDWKEGVKHTMDNHKQFAKKGAFKNQELEMLGFYSDHHQGVFTHHDATTHIHITGGKPGQVGHLDDIRIIGTVKILLPYHN